MERKEKQQKQKKQDITQKTVNIQQEKIIRNLSKMDESEIQRIL